MASFSTLYPVAYHVAPLHALKGILTDGALLSKAEAPQSRPTTGQIDRALGFDGFVHFYLGSPARVRDLPILKAQLQPSSRPPFPHVVLELPTASLTDEESVICYWNLAVSRPEADGVKGGNWSRGTKATRIAEHWRFFRAGDPPLSRAHGHFNEPYLVPTLAKSQISRHLDLLRPEGGKFLELLLRAPVPLAFFSRLLVFSERDHATVELLGPMPLPCVKCQYPGYEHVPAETRRKIEAFFAAPQGTPAPTLDFDAVRPRA